MKFRLTCRFSNHRISTLWRPFCTHPSGHLFPESRHAQFFSKCRNLSSAAVVHWYLRRLFHRTNRKHWWLLTCIIVMYWMNEKDQQHWSTIQSTIKLVEIYWKKPQNRSINYNLESIAAQLEKTLQRQLRKSLSGREQLWHSQSQIRSWTTLFNLLY